MKYRAEIDGLRALAVLPVILFHAGFELFSGGFVGVDVFFVISGYLITTIIISEMAEGKFSIVNFYERRARRILPALFFVMGVCLPFAYILLTPFDLKSFGQSLVAVSLFSSNILFWLESGYFETAAELKPLLHTWSLAVEEQYYIFFPIFLVLTWRLGVKWIIILLSVVFFASLGIAQWGAYNSPSGAFFLLPARGWELLIGVFAAFYLNYNTHLKSNSINEILSLLGFSMILYSIIAFDKTTPFPSIYALIPTIGTVLLILCAVPKTIIHKFLSLKFIVGIGLISYSAYLWHQPLLAFTKYKFIDEISAFLLIGIVFISLFMAYLSWRFVEKPFRDKLKIKRNTIFQISFVTALFFVVIGLWLNKIDGGLRFQSPERQIVLSNFMNSTEYVTKRHKDIRLAQYKKNEKSNILIIGDSHSEDLVNAVFEAGLNLKKDFSSYYIPVRCGVLFVKDKKAREDPNFNCQRFSFFDEKLITQISNSDEVWIISSWKESDIKYMEESLNNILILDKKVRLFGTKNFGKVDARWFVNNEIDTWNTQIFSKKDLIKLRNKEKINKALTNISNSYDIEFVNTQHLICKGKDFCPNYRDGNIISHDGDHLTRHGAKILGESIKNLLTEKNNK